MQDITHEELTIRLSFWAWATKSSFKFFGSSLLLVLFNLKAWVFELSELPCRLWYFHGQILFQYIESSMFLYWTLHVLVKPMLMNYPQVCHWGKIDLSWHNFTLPNRFARVLPDLLSVHVSLHICKITTILLNTSIHEQARITWFCTSEPCLFRGKLIRPVSESREFENCDDLRDLFAHCPSLKIVNLCGWYAETIHENLSRFAGDSPLEEICQETSQ